MTRSIKNALDYFCGGINFSGFLLLTFTISRFIGLEVKQVVYDSWRARFRPLCRKTPLEELS